jgi:hypothetical protein
MARRSSGVRGAAAPASRPAAGRSPIERRHSLGVIVPGTSKLRGKSSASDARFFLPYAQPFSSAAHGEGDGARRPTGHGESGSTGREGPRHADSHGCAGGDCPPQHFLRIKTVPSVEKETQQSCRQGGKQTRGKCCGRFEHEILSPGGCTTRRTVPHAYCGCCLWVGGCGAPMEETHTVASKRLAASPLVQHFKGFIQQLYSPHRLHPHVINHGPVRRVSVASPLPLCGGKNVEPISWWYP